MNLTPWYPAHIKPVRKGLYRTRSKGWPKLAWLVAWWDGKLWRWAEGENVILSQNRQWRGVYK